PEGVSTPKVTPRGASTPDPAVSAITDPSVVGRGVDAGFLPVDEVRAIAGEGLARLPLDGRRVLVLIPDGTRTMPMPLLFDVLDQAVGPRAAALDFLVALGTHAPMSDAQLS